MEGGLPLPRELSCARHAHRAAKRYDDRVLVELCGVEDVIKTQTHMFRPDQIDDVVQLMQETLDEVERGAANTTRRAPRPLPRCLKRRHKLFS
jgi:hypothetical protein